MKINDEMEAKFREWWRIQIKERLRRLNLHPQRHDPAAGLTLDAQRGKLQEQSNDEMLKELEK